ncbi:hypothetical protein LguiA_006723 [Lonicera macranthoides]
MKNGSLREWLCKKKPEGTNEWTHRIWIVLDVANGLHYLHNFTEPACIHKDIKSSNILLDANLRAKIANFSLASTAITEGTDTKALTTRILRTRGYMAPEYIEMGALAPKTDVYAFGVVMLELITGKEAAITQEGREVLLTAVIASIMEGKNVQTELRYFIDPCLGENKMKYVVGVVKLSLKCLRRDATSRPSMSDVA